MSSDAPPDAAVVRLPIGETVKATYRAVLVEHLGSLPAACAVPFLLSLIIFALTMYISFRGISAGDGAPGPSVADSLLNLALFPVALVPYVIFAVAWHRLLLLGPGVASAVLLPGWGRRHWRSLGYLILVTLVVYGLVLVPFLAAIVVLAVVSGGVQGSDGPVAMVLVALLTAIAALCVLPYLYARWCLVFPAIAVDERFGMRDSWRLTRSQGWRIVATGLLVVLPFVLAAILVMAVMGQSMAGSLVAAMAARDLPGFLMSLGTTSVVNMALGYVMLALIVTMVTLAFRTLTGWIPDAQAIADAFR